MAIRRLRDETRFPARLVVNAATGNDENTLVTEIVTVNGVTGIEQLTATLATLQGAFNLIPQEIRHPIFIELPLATITAGLTGPVTAGPEASFTGRLIDLANAVDLDPPNLTFDALPGVYIIGQPIQVIAPAAVTSAAASNVAGFAGLTDDAHRGQIVEVVSGTGVGQKRRIIRNNATTVQLQSPWTVTPDITSTVRITRAGSIIDGAVICGEMLGARSQAALSFDLNTKILANAAAAVGNALMVRGAAVAFGGEIEGLAEGSAALAIFQEESSFLFPDVTNLRDDPTGANELPAGMFLTNGTWGITDRGGALGTVGGAVMTASRITVTDQSKLQIRIDPDGDRPTLGGRTAGPGVDVNRGSIAVLSAAVGTGNAMQGYTIAGARAQRNSEIAVPGMTVNDNDEGILVLENSIGDVNGTLTSANNDAFGAIVRGNSQLYIDRDTTTLTGATNDAFLGNATSGFARAWTDCNAADALLNGGGEAADNGGAIAAGNGEWGVLIDRAAP